jgi:hypothetical protein
MRSGELFNAPRLSLEMAALTAVLSLISAPAMASKGNHDDDKKGVCTRTAEMLRTACRFDVKDDFWLSKANCLNVSDGDERRECYEEAQTARREAREECRDQFEARLELCEAVGESRYDPDFSPERFVDPRQIGITVAENPYFPLVEGNKWVYESTFTDEDGEEVTETITVVVTEKTKLIEGVSCRVVNDLVLVDEGDGPVPLEDTNDWYAQDVDGNVWYCGEEVKDFETFEGDDPVEPELVSIDGSFKAGRDRARAGVLMLAAPQVGDVYRQEAAFGDAEDFAEVTSLSGSESVPAASCNGDCLVAREGNLLEPGVFADKYYAPGIGNILEVEEGVRVELMEFTPGTP